MSAMEEHDMSDQTVPAVPDVEYDPDGLQEEEEARAETRDHAIYEAAERAYVVSKGRDLAKEWVRAEAQRDLPPPRGESMLDILESDYEDTWLIDGFIPADGKFLIVAPAKAGKTTTVTNLVHALATRKPFLGKFPVESDRALKVTILDNEMSPGLLKKWYARLGMDEEALEHITMYRLLGHAHEFDPTVEESRARWVEHLRGQDVVIIDCLSPFLAAVGLDENSEARMWLNALDRLMAEAEVTAYGVIHHTGHEGERARGDSAILGWATQTIGLVVEGLGPDDPNPTRFIKAISGRNDEPVPLGMLTFEQATGLLNYRGGVTRKSAKDSRTVLEKRWDTHVTKLVDEYGYEKWFTVPEASSICGITEKPTREMLEYGVGLKRVDRRKAGGRSGGGGYEYQVLPYLQVIETS